MTEPSTAAAVVAASASLTLFGVATGLDPAVLLAGFAGGVWSQSYADPEPFFKRLLLVGLSSVLAGYLSPVASAILYAQPLIANSMAEPVLQLPLGVLIGLTAHRGLGPAITRAVNKRVDK